MTDRPDDHGQTTLDVADRKMLAEIKASVLGASQAVFRIGRFRVLDRLGEGSMGIVFAAIDDQLQRRVAIKLLHQGVGASEGERRSRLLREAQMLAQLEHPNIVHVYEAGEHDGQVFMAMELVEGQALDVLQRARPPGEWRMLLPIYVAAGHGLAAAHAQGVVHRDFKPHNVLVDAKGRVRVVDFGLARESAETDQQLTAEIALADEGAIERPRDDHLTATGIVPGTPAYMAPELFDGQPASPASDQYSFCVALYEALYGRRPFEAARLQDLIDAAKRGQILPPPPESPVPRWLFEVVARGLAASPEARHPSMDALLAELERDRARRWKQAGGLVAVAAVLGVTWWASARSQPLIGLGLRPPERDPAIVARRAVCREQAGELAKHWRDHQEQLVHPPVDQDDADGLVQVFDADVARLIARWAGACVEEPEASEECRARAQAAFEVAVVRGAERPLHADAFHEITSELELCLEGGEPSSCRGPERESAALEALSEAQAAQLTGDVDGALAHAERSISLAVAAGDEHTRLRATLRKGAILEARGELEAARSALDDVVFDALVCDADVLALDAALERAEVETLHFGRLEPARRFLVGAGRILDKRGASALPLRQARLLEKWGTAELYLEHDCAEALPRLQRALDLRNEVVAERARQGLPTAHVERLVANAQLNLANVGFYALTEASKRCELGGWTSAEVIEEYRAARNRFDAAVEDPRHLELADFDYSLGSAILEVGKAPEDAIAPLEAALSIYAAHHGDHSPVVGDAHRALAAAHRAARDLARARQHAEACVAIRLLHEDGPRLARAEAHDALGTILHEQGLHDDARDALSRAIEALREPELELLELNELEQLYMSELNLALVEHDRGDRAAVRLAAVRLRELQRAIEARTGEPHQGFAQQRLVEAWILLYERQPDAALARLEGVEQLRGFVPTLEERIAEARDRATSIE